MTDDEFDKVIGDMEDYNLVLVNMEETPRAFDVMVSAGEVFDDEDKPTGSKIIFLQFLTLANANSNEVVNVEFVVPVDTPLGEALVTGALTERVVDRLKD